MAAYFHGNSEIQSADGYQTLVLMNPGYIQYSDTPPPPASNLLLLNHATANSFYSQNLPHAPSSHTQQFVGIPLPAAATPTSLDPSSHPMHSHHDVSALHSFISRNQNNLWNPIDPSPTARETPRAKQGLSLSLSSQQQQPHPGYGSIGDHREFPARAQQAVSGDEIHISGGGSSSSASGVTNGIPSMRGVLMSSKYLRAAQELLVEVVNVGDNGIKKESMKKSNAQLTKLMGESSVAAAGDGSIGTDEAGGKRGTELSAADRQEIQMKKGKLINMLDEVEQRYRQYYHQMQIIISSFEQAAGIGSATTYTALALRTISKQFRCLKDTITSQIRFANKSLGEEEISPNGKIEGSRLKFVDHQLRQQRALQQLGMIQHNAWRPQRGLPERSVSVLRAWLFEHFLHPYPKDSDKHMLAKQTGLTRSQVSNWFINARVRLWKPMVEEMYMEEIKEQEQNGSMENMSKSNEDSVSKSTSPRAKTAISDTQPTSFSSKLESYDGFTQGSPKKQRIAEMMDCEPGEANNEHVSMKFVEQRENRDEYSFIRGQTNFIGGFGQYPIGEIGRFDAEQFTTRFSGNNGVSLSLGLPHSENLSLSVANQSFIPNQNIHFGRRLEPNDLDAINTSAPHPTTAFENLSIQTRKRFAAQLLPDFVA